MTEQTDQANAPTGIGFGARLKEVRETLHLSEKDIAARLHLNSRIIHIIEKEDFTNGPPAIFMRGYVRSYARLLNFSDNEINTALTHLGLTIPSSNHLTSRLQTEDNTITNERYIKFATYLVIGISAILVGIWWESHSRTTISDNLLQMVTQQTAAIPTEPKDVTVAQSTHTTTVANATSAPTSQPVIQASTAPIAQAEPNITTPITLAKPSTNPTENNLAAHTPKKKPFHQELAPPANATDMAASLPEPGLDIYD